MTNNSGTTYNAARLKLVAGDVNRVQDEMRYKLGMEMDAMAAPMAAGGEIGRAHV